MDFPYWATWGEVLPTTSGLNLARFPGWIPRWTNNIWHFPTGNSAANFNLDNPTNSSVLRSWIFLPNGKGKSSNKELLKFILALRKYSFLETDGLHIDSQRPVTEEATWKPKLERNTLWLFWDSTNLVFLWGTSVIKSGSVCWFWKFGGPPFLGKENPYDFQRWNHLKKNNQLCIDTVIFPQFSGLNIPESFHRNRHWEWIGFIQIFKRNLYGGITNMLICNTNKPLPFSPRYTPTT